MFLYHCSFSKASTPEPAHLNCSSASSFGPHGFPDIAGALSVLRQMQYEGLPALTESPHHHSTPNTVQQKVNAVYFLSKITGLLLQPSFCCKKNVPLKFCHIHTPHTLLHIYLPHTTHITHTNTTHTTYTHIPPTHTHIPPGGGRGGVGKRLHPKG